MYLVDIEEHRRPTPFVEQQIKRNSFNVNIVLQNVLSSLVPRFLRKVGTFLDRFERVTVSPAQGV